MWTNSTLGGNDCSLLWLDTYFDFLLKTWHPWKATANGYISCGINLKNVSAQISHGKNQNSSPPVPIWYLQAVMTHLTRNLLTSSDLASQSSRYLQDSNSAVVILCFSRIQGFGTIWVQDCSPDLNPDPCLGGALDPVLFLWEVLDPEPWSYFSITTMPCRLVSCEKQPVAVRRATQQKF